MAFLTRLRLNLPFTNPKISTRTNINFSFNTAQSHFWCAHCSAKSVWMLSYGIQFHFPATTPKFKLKPSWVCVVKIINDPELLSLIRWWAVETLLYISCNFTQVSAWLQTQLKQNTGPFSGSKWGSFLLKHLWEQQPSNKNTQALKSTLRLSKGLDPKSELGLKTTSVCYMLLPSVPGPQERFLWVVWNWTSLLLFCNKSRILSPAEQTALAACSGFDRVCLSEPAMVCVCVQRWASTWPPAHQHHRQHTNVREKHTVYMHRKKYELLNSCTEFLSDSS